MAQNTEPNAKIRDIVRRNIADSAHKLIRTLSGQGRKRKRATAAKMIGKAKKARRQPVKFTIKKRTKKRNIKRDIFS